MPEQDGPCGRGCWFDKGVEKRVLLPLSTGHLTHDTCNLTLGPGSSALPALAAHYELGLFLYVPDEGDEDMPPDLLACVLFARAQNASYIQFDCDGPEYEELPKYEW